MLSESNDAVVEANTPLPCAAHVARPQPYNRRVGDRWYGLGDLLPVRSISAAIRRQHVALALESHPAVRKRHAERATPARGPHVPIRMGRVGLRVAGNGRSQTNAAMPSQALPAGGASSRSTEASMRP